MIIILEVGKNWSLNMTDYEKDYEEFWKDIVEKDGKIDLEQIKKELYDYHCILKEVPKVYGDITGGRISKANTKSEFVIAESNDRINELVEESINSYIEENFTLNNAYCLLDEIIINGDSSKESLYLWFLDERRLIEQTVNNLKEEIQIT